MLPQKKKATVINFSSRILILISTIFLLAPAYSSNQNTKEIAKSAPLHIIVMDPLSDHLACSCVAGYAHRKYEVVCKFLAKKLKRSFKVTYTESLLSSRLPENMGIDLVVGKYSEVMSDAKTKRIELKSLAMLTGQDGEITLKGLFVVRSDDKAKSISDLKNYKILLGPKDSDEKHSAALATMENFGLSIGKKITTSPSCSSAALDVVEKRADAAVISSYAMPLLQGCGTIDKGALRVVGKTDEVPFICVFTSNRIDSATEDTIEKALLETNKDPDILKAMESKKGFVKLRGIFSNSSEPQTDWPDWRGPKRDAVSPDVPLKLSSEKRLLWARTLTGYGMSGVAVSSGLVIISDKGLHEKKDIFRCLDADTGEEIWKLSYAAAGKMEFSNSPRANPVIVNELVYLLGAFGHLHCVNLKNGNVLWKKQLVKDFGSKLPTWGMSSTPLVVGDKLIVNPGATNASVVALNRFTGKVLWTTPGDPPGYSSFILIQTKGIRQIVGYDAISLGGWDIKTGKRLWKLIPENEGDFNVPTPIITEGKLLVTTENNGTRLYEFDKKGIIKSNPVAINENLAPDTSTPVVQAGMVFGCCGALHCLDLKNSLKTLWEADEDDFCNYCSLIAGKKRILITTQTGKLYLVEVSRKGYKCISKLDLFEDIPVSERAVWSHPALVGNRFYVRNLLGIYCFLLDSDSAR